MKAKSSMSSVSQFGESNADHNVKVLNELLQGSRLRRCHGAQREVEAPQQLQVTGHGAVASRKEVVLSLHC
jgi:hypothetical protein